MPSKKSEGKTTQVSRPPTSRQEKLAEKNKLADALKVAKEKELAAVAAEKKAEAAQKKAARQAQQPQQAQHVQEVQQLQRIKESFQKSNTKFTSISHPKNLSSMSTLIAQLIIYISKESIERKKPVDNLRFATELLEKAVNTYINVCHIQYNYEHITWYDIHDSDASDASNPLAVLYAIPDVLSCQRDAAEKRFDAKVSPLRGSEPLLIAMDDTKEKKTTFVDVLNRELLILQQEGILQEKGILQEEVRILQKLDLTHLQYMNRESDALLKIQKSNYTASIRYNQISSLNTTLSSSEFIEESFRYLQIDASKLKKDPFN